MKSLPLLLLAALLLGCSGSGDDEGGTSTATPADKLGRPGPVDTASGPSNVPSADAGTLPSK